VILKATNNIFSVSLNENLMFKQERQHVQISFHYEIITGLYVSYLQTVSVVTYINET